MTIGLIDLIPPFLVVEIILSLIALGAALWAWSSAKAAEDYAKTALWAKPPQRRDARGRFIPRFSVQGGTARDFKSSPGRVVAHEGPNPPVRRDLVDE